MTPLSRYFSVLRVDMCVSKLLDINIISFMRQKYSGMSDYKTQLQERNSVSAIMMVCPNEKNGYEVDIRRVIKAKVIGEGSLGIVYSGHLLMKSSLRRVAIKTLKGQSIYSKFPLEEVSSS